MKNCKNYLFALGMLMLCSSCGIIERIEERVAQDKYVNTEELNGILRSEIVDLLAENNNAVELEDFTVPEDKKHQEEERVTPLSVSPFLYPDTTLPIQHNDLRTARHIP